ncbi:MAG: efflux RND transporter permease subunit [Verrucomicrobia bacterium]|jgi:hydrophobic/amphiphilic exporter-1 (mainly G- bacteria), HAE1 family|nr:efflux RND transporter permease subunit [Verrucomicrobiota bacterium]MBT7064751.1 efflux RND transporter permease subunit [Verrucomicrobiota bacterium]MBT7699169.1 efflux RND transporter permease subunit [Verrucomicrobiota bacterium]
MILSDASIRRPIAMACLIIGLALLGLNAFRKMGLELMPKMELPFVTVQTIYPGASPSEIETDIAKKIEDAVGTIDGLKHISSSCMEDVGLTFLEFQLDVDVDVAAMDVREKLDLIKSDLPADAEDPVIQKFDINAKAIVTLGLTGDAPLDELYDYADNTFRDRLSIVSGVADVELIGGAEREVQVLLDRDELAARGLSSLQVVQAIQAGVRLIPVGRIREGDTEYSVKFDADYRDIDRIGDLELVSVDGRRCYIRDVATVAMGTEEVRQSAIVDGRPGVAIKIVKKSDANAVAVADGVREAFSELQSGLPGGMELVWISDDGTFIRATNASAWSNVFQGVLLTVAILFLFLYNLRALLVVGITMPLTIVVGLFFMQMAGMTLNTPTLIAIGMSVGILVTNSIVVLEGIVKRLGEGKTPKEAAQLGAKETFVAVLASAGTNMVVLFPLALMGSMVGNFIRPLALTMFIMTVVSLFLSFTLTPMLCSLLLKPANEKQRGVLGRMEAGWNRGLDAVIGVYRRILQFNERHRWAAALLMVVVVLMFVHSLKVGGAAGFNMFSDTDKGEVYVKLEFPTSSTLATTEKGVSDAVERLEGLPQLRHMLVTVGKVEGMVGQATEGVHLAQCFLRFSERIEREETIHELMEMARAEMASFPGAMVSLSIPSMIGGDNIPVEMEIAGPDLDTLDALAIRAADLAGGVDGLRDIDTTARPGKPELRVYPNRTILSDAAIPATTLGMALRANVAGMDAGSFKSGARTYDIVVKYEEQEGKGQVEQFALPGGPGHALALTTLADVRDTLAPVQITREDKRRVAKLFSQLEPGAPLGPAMQNLTTAMEEEGDLPPGYEFRFGGMGEMMGEAMVAFGEAGLIGIILVILALAAILESFRQPALILVTLPLGLIGMLWALGLTGKSMDVFSMMGAVMMVGIVVNNAILIMDQFNVHVAEGVPRHKAMITAATERFRPVLMVTIAAVLGMMPLAVSQGIGGEMRNNVGIGCVGGILVSGILTLFVMPVLYDLFTRKGMGRKAK